VLLTRSPLVYPRRGLTARLACVKHAASVRPEPGSNSPQKPELTKNTNWHKQTPQHPQKGVMKKLSTLLSSQKTSAHQPATPSSETGSGQLSHDTQYETRPQPHALQTLEGSLAARGPLPVKTRRPPVRPARRRGESYTPPDPGFSPGGHLASGRPVLAAQRPRAQPRVPAGTGGKRGPGRLRR
jgi:hypothetical protein